MIDQTTLGHTYIYNIFGDAVKPRVGWSLDPFGYSTTTPKINHLSGMKYHMMCRVSFDVKNKMMDESSLEVC